MSFKPHNLLLCLTLVGCQNGPQTRRGEISETLHGTQVADPYRWLEDASSPETQAWIKDQNQRTRAILDELPGRASMGERLTELWDYERFNLPSKQGPRYVISHNDGLQAQSVLYTMNELDGERSVLLDPNGLSSDGTMALAGTSFSHDGEWLAYGLSDGGSDWNTWHIRKVSTGEDLSDVLRWVKFSTAAWTIDGKGFYYSRYAPPADGEELVHVNLNQELYYHELGTDQSQDQLIYKRPDKPEWGFSPEVSDDGRYLVLTIWKGTDPANCVFYRDLTVPNSPMVELRPRVNAHYDFVGNLGHTFILVTNLDAPRSRLISIDLEHPDQSTELVPEGSDTLVSVSMVGGQFLCESLQDAHSVVRVRELSGELRGTVDLPGIGTAVGFMGKLSEPETFFAYTSYATPATLYRYDVKQGKSTLYQQPALAFDPELFTTKQIFASSPDGTRIPLFVTHKRGINLDGSNPTILYGYGGFNVSLTPSFRPKNIAWMERGGIFVEAILRGGGEYGKDWHEAGTLASKQNVFDDFIAAAEHLIREGYTSPAKLAIKGGSNGGLLVGAVLNQRPELFGAALPAVGVMDMLRYHKFTIGWAWASDYGTAEDADQFRTLLAYSPYHNAQTSRPYPPTLVTTAERDDRVVPLHSFKYTAAMQHAQCGDAPIMIRIETRAGHGAGRPVQMVIDEATDQMAFLTWALGEG